MKKFFSFICIAILSLNCTLSLACSCGSYYEGVQKLDDLKDYPFIALVRITSERVVKDKPANHIGDIAQLGIEVIEQFKGEKLTEILESEINTSCDLGIEPGEEWIVFAKTYHGRLTLFACDRNLRYKEKDGQKDWHFLRGIREVNDLRKLYEHQPKKFADGIHKEFYPNGKPEWEETYANGRKNGTRKVYYPSGTIFGIEFYVNDSLQGKSVWHFPSGQVADQKYFERGQPRNVTRAYYDSSTNLPYKKFLIKDFYKTEDSLQFAYHRIQPVYEVIHDSFGRPIISRQFRRLGTVDSERILDPVSGMITSIYYYENGNVRSIGYMKDKTYDSYGHYQEYDEKGTPSKSWEYDEKGIQIKSTIWIRDKK